MATDHWVRTPFMFPHTLPAPLVENAFPLYNLSAGQTVLRNRLEFQLNVATAGSGGGFSAEYWTEVTAAVGVWWSDAASPPPISQTPISGSSSSDWLIIDYLYPRVDVYDTLTPVSVVSFVPRPGLLESFAQRRVATSNTGTVWLAWEVVDPSGLINAAGAGITYPMAAGGFEASLYRAP